MDRQTDTGIAIVSRILAWIAGFLILLSAVLVSVDVLTRSIFKLTFMSSFELSSYAFAAAVTLGLSYTLILRSHIRIEVVYVLLKPRLRIVLDFLAIITLAITASVFTWHAMQTVWYSWSINAHSNTPLAVPMVVPQGIWLVGLAWFAITTIWLFFRALGHLSNGRWKLVSEEIGVLALEDEIEQSEIPVAGAAAERQEMARAGLAPPDV